MRAAGTMLVCLGASVAHAQPPGHETTPAPVATPSPNEAQALSVELAGTWSGKTGEPMTGWRAAILHPITTRRAIHSPQRSSISAIVRYDDHGAPEESGDAETTATSWSAGLRATSLWASSGLRLGFFAEGTVGITRARHADEMASQRDGHVMASVGFLAGTSAFQLVTDFGWLVTRVGDGRIGPIASLGLHVVFE